MTAKTIGICSLATVFTFLLLWEKVQATRLGYEVGRTRTTLRERRNRISYLRLELERLKSPERLAEAARRRLGMTPASPETLVFLGSEVPRVETTTVAAAPAAPITRPLLASAPAAGGGTAR